MTRDASLPPNAPMTNGTLTPGHGEADASTMPSAPHPERPSLKEVCADVHSRVTAFLGLEATDETLRRTQEQVRVGIGIVEKALEDYEFEHLSLSYNGGKDCLVLLLLYLSVLHTHFDRRQHSRRREESEDTPITSRTNEEQQIDTFPTTIPSIYAKPPDPFPLVTSFVESSSFRYHLDLIHISTNPGPSPKSKSHSSPPPTAIPAPPSASSASHTDPNPTTNLASTGQDTQSANQVITFRDAFALYLSHHHPSCRAIFVGTRRTDPHGATLQAFQMTDGLWPRFMRVHPVLDFGLAEVWAFLRHPTIRDGVGCDTIPKEGANRGGNGGEGREVIDYCLMYDQGYTSLGGVGDTHRNPKLKDANYDEGYKPAWTMTEDEEERLGRE